MAELLDANWFRGCAFGVASVALIVAWRYEAVQLGRVGATARCVLWPTCWLLIAGIYAAMAGALGADLAGRVGGLGREYARNEDWYDSRRPLQAAIVVIVAIVWLTIIVVGIWRVPERRRRYLPSALLCTSLICFGLIRIVSFHYVDTIVDRTSVVGVPLGTVVELVGIVVAVVLAVRASRRPVADDRNVPASPSVTARRAAQAAG